MEKRYYSELDIAEMAFGQRELPDDVPEHVRSIVEDEEINEFYKIAVLRAALKE